MASEPRVLRLTATRRLARALQDRERDRRAAGGSAAYLPAPTWQLDDWLRDRWERGWPDRVRLGERQSEALWEAEAARFEGAALLVDVPQRVSQALRAHSLLSEWRVAPPALSPGLPTQTQRFLEWRRAVARRLDEGGWIDLPAVLEGGLESVVGGQAAVAAGTRVELLGFDRWTPRTRELRVALERAGCDVRWVPPAEPLRPVRRYAARDADDEIVRAARWSRECLEQNPNARIGVIVPQLADRLARVGSAFEDELTPGAIRSPDPDAIVHRHNLSLAPTLGSWPLVSCALTTLEVSSEVGVEDLSRLVRSPFLAGGMSEALDRARLEHEILRGGRVRLALSAVRALAHRLAPGFARVLDVWARAREARPATASASVWARSFRALLRDSGWPGERAVNSSELQTVRAFDTLLDDLASLGCLAAPFDHDCAVSRLRRWSDEVRFQPLGRWAPVQILGVLEAGGLEFDHLWVMGLDDESWPPRSHPSPLLPIDWQRLHGLPHACPELEREFWRGITRRLLGSASEGIVSFAAQVDGRAQRLSPWVDPHIGADLDATPARSAAWVRQWVEARERVAESRPLDGWVESTSDAIVPGGVQVIADQAQCPFRAFARHRLGARRRVGPRETFGASERGRLLHRVMELVWSRWGTQSVLMERGEAGRVADVAAAVEAAAQEIIAPRDDLPELVRRLEIRRTQEVVLAWLDVELARPPFVVQALEADHEVSCGGLRLRGRIDRLDRWPAHPGEPSVEYAILDYKTGATWRPQAWSGERPDAPQLPLYVTSLRIPVAAVAFGVLDRREMGLRGWVRGLEGWTARAMESLDRESWSQVVESWQASLDRLGAAFRAGDARVDPKPGAQSCSACDLHGLCRVAERAPGVGGLESHEAPSLEGEELV